MKGFLKENLIPVLIHFIKKENDIVIRINDKKVEEIYMDVFKDSLHNLDKNFLDKTGYYFIV